MIEGYQVDFSSEGMTVYMKNEPKTKKDFSLTHKNALRKLLNHTNPSRFSKQNDPYPNLD